MNESNGQGKYSERFGCLPLMSFRKSFEKIIDHNESSLLNFDFFYGPHEL